MKRVFTVFILLLCLLLFACNSTTATPTTSTGNDQSTALSVALSALSITGTSIRTETVQPPTSTSTDTPVPTITRTLEPSVTFTPIDTATITKSPCNQPLKSWKVPTTTFSIVNETKPKGMIILSLSVLTDMSECGYLVINGTSFSGPVGRYSAFAYVSGDKNFTVSGSFIIKNVPYKIVVMNEKIIEAYSCYPHC